MGILSDLFKKYDEKNNLLDDEDLMLEEKMDDLNLEEWQKELVREGKYNIEDFEEEELDEDSYYYEEDDEYEEDEEDY